MTPQQRPAPPPDLAGRHLAKFFTDYLAGERAASPRTIASYRDALKLLLIWFKTAEHIPPGEAAPGRHRPAPHPTVPALAGNRTGLLGGHPQPAPRGDQVVLPPHRRRTARPPRPGHPHPRDPAEEDPRPNPGHLTGDEVKALLAEPGTNGTRAIRDTVLLALAYDTAARVQELCDLNVTDIRRGAPMTVTIRGKGSKTRYVPATGPTAGLVADYLEHREPHPGVGADTDPLFHGPNHARLTRSGVAKLLAKHVRAVRACDPGWAPGLPVTPRTLRRSRAMHLIQAGVNMIYIRDLLGHADIATTEIYARADAETKRKAIETPTSRSPPTRCPTGPRMRP